MERISLTYLKTTYMFKALLTEDTKTNNLDGVNNKIINGVSSDWVYEEEFS